MRCAQNCPHSPVHFFLGVSSCFTSLSLHNFICSFKVQCIHNPHCKQRPVLETCRRVVVEFRIPRAPTGDSYPLAGQLPNGHKWHDFIPRNVQPFNQFFDPFAEFAGILCAANWLIRNIFQRFCEHAPNNFRHFPRKEFPCWLRSVGVCIPRYCWASQACVWCGP